MKHWLWYLAIAVAAGVLGSRNSVGSDIGQLQPVQVVRVMTENGQVLIQTDTGDWGAGDSLSAAVDNMKKTSAAEIFLDTADYLLISEETEPLLPELRSYLRPSCMICREGGQADLQLAGQYLETHSLDTTLIRWLADRPQLPILITQEGRMTLVS